VRPPPTHLPTGGEPPLRFSATITARRGTALSLFPDDGNRMELATSVGARPDGPFVRAPLYRLRLDSRPTDGSGRRHEHLVGVVPANRTG